MNKATTKQEAKQLLALGTPAIIAQLAQAGLGTIDTMMAGHYNAKALAAVALGNNLFYPALVLLIGIMLSLNPTMAQLNGKENFAQMRRVFHNGIYLALIISIPGILMMHSFLPIMQWRGIDPTTAGLADGYLKAVGWGFPGLALFFVMRFTNEGLFDNKVVMKVALSALPVNFLANLWFIHGGLGLPSMGAVGVGWATTVVYYYMFLALFIYTLIAKRYRHIRFLDDWQAPDFDKIKEMLKLGIPMGLSLGLEVTLFAVIGVMIASHGDTPMASHQIAINIASVSYMMPLGLSMAITARVGYHIGKDNPVMSRDAGYIGAAMALVMMLFNAAILICFPQQLVELYSKDLAVVTLATQLLFFAALFQLSDGVQVASLGALRGLKDTKMPMYITAFAYWVIGFPSGVYAAEVLGWGLEGYWVAMISSLSIAAILLTVRFVKLMNQKIAQSADSSLVTQKP